MQKQRTKNNRDGGGVLIGGFSVAVMTGLFFMMIFAWIMTAKDLPVVCITIFSYTILIFSSLFGGWIASRIAKEQGMKIGGIIGGGVFIILFIIGVITNGFPGDIGFIAKGVVSVLAGMVGGVIGVNRANRRKMQ